MKTMIAIPCLDMTSTIFMENLLALRRPAGSMVVTARASLVYDARNQLGQMAITEGFDRIMWLDSDMTFEPDLMERLTADLDEGCRMVTSICFSRKNPIKPIIYSETGYKECEDGSGRYTTYSVCMDDYPRDELFTVKGLGLAATMMDVSVVRQVYERFGSPFSPINGFGEDLSFCRKCDELGIPMHCDSRIKVGHIAQTIVTEETYFNGVVL